MPTRAARSVSRRLLKGESFFLLHGVILEFLKRDWWFSMVFIHCADGIIP